MIMKTQQTSIFGLLSIALVFTACQKDNIVDMDILADKDAQIEMDGSGFSTDASIPEPPSLDNSAIELNQVVKIKRPDCASGSSLEKVGDDNRSSREDCYGEYGLSGNDGRSWVAEFGSFTSHVALQYDPVSNELTGKVTLEFDGEPAALVLVPTGSVERRISPSEGSNLMVDIQSKRGAGPLGGTNFKGQIYIMHSDLVFSSKSLENEVNIMIKGSFGVEARDPGEYAIERTHNDRSN